MKICDVCYKEGKVVPSTYTIWHKNRRDGWEEKIRLDTCRAHSNFFKGGSFKQNKRNYRIVKNLPVD